MEDGGWRMEDGQDVASITLRAIFHPRSSILVFSSSEPSTLNPQPYTMDTPLPPFPTFIPRKAIRYRQKPAGSGEQAAPVALMLVAATYDTDDFSVTLVFDRAVDAAGLDAAAITVDDGEFAAGLFEGAGPATIVNPTTIKLFLEEIGGPTVNDVELTATATGGIVAVDDGGTWAGVTAVVLPFP